MQLTRDLIEQKMPMIMGILNLAPGSFASEGRCLSVDDALRHVEKIIEEGVDIIDIGAEPTNPQQIAQTVSAEDELSLLLPVIDAIRQRFDTPLSIDTSDPVVMRAVIAHGADMINDIRALTRPGALEVAAELDVPVCLMHRCKYVPQQAIVDVVCRYLSERLDQAITAGIKPEHIILDPGLGGGSFGKDCEQNLQLLRAIPQLTALGYPVLIGLSRKTFIGKILNCPEHERIYAGLTLNNYAASQGAAIIRTHDVRALRDGLTVTHALGV